MNIEEMRKTLILFTIRDYPAHKSEHKVYLDILRWQQMKPEKVKAWYNKFFQHENTFYKDSE